MDNKTLSSDSSAPEEIDVPKETLISLLKDKSKELKTLSLKLSKIEEKYVKVFKDYKNLLKDKEAYEKYVAFTIKNYSVGSEYGVVDANNLMSLYSSQQEAQNQALAELMSQFNREKADYEAKISVLTEKQAKASQAQSENEVLRGGIKELEEKNARLGDEVMELNGRLARQAKEKDDYKKLEQEFSQFKAEILLKELQLKSSKSEALDLKNKLKEVEKSSEILRLKQSLDSAMEKITHLENLLSLQENLLHTKTPEKTPPPPSLLLPSSLPPPSLLPPSLYPSPFLIPSSSQSNIHFHPPETPPEKEEEGGKKEEERRGGGEEGGRREGVGKEEGGRRMGGGSKEEHEYLKNVLLKFFIYLEGRNWNEAGILMQVIVTIMGMTKEEKAKIEEAKSRASLWNWGREFLNDTLWGQKNRNLNYEKGNEGMGN